MVTSGNLSPHTEQTTFFFAAGAAAAVLVAVCDVAWFFMARRVVYAFGHLGHLYSFPGLELGPGSVVADFFAPAGLLAPPSGVAARRFREPCGAVFSCLSV